MNKLKQNIIDEMYHNRIELKMQIKEIDHRLWSIISSIENCKDLESLKQEVINLIYNLWSPGLNKIDYKNKGICFKAYEDALNVLNYNNENIRKQVQSLYIRSLFNSMNKRLDKIEKQLNTSEFKWKLNELDSWLGYLRQQNEAFYTPYGSMVEEDE